MKIAFIILAHNLPNQLKRLVNRLQSPEHHFLIHIDARSDAVFHDCARLFSQEKNVTLALERTRCRWGQFGLIEATISCLRQLSAFEENFDYVCLLSGQDYPIKSIEEIEAFFSENAGKQFIESFRLDQENMWTNHGGAFQAMERIEKFHVALKSRWFHTPIKRKLPNGIDPYGGSQWWNLTGDCVRWIVNYLDDNPKFIQFFRHTFIPDELFFQCLVMNSPFKKNAVSDSLRFVDWTRGHPTPPAIMQVGDLTLLQSQSQLFARKFNEMVDSDIFDALDASIAADQHPPLKQVAH